MKDMRIGFIDISGLWSTFHHVLAMDENFDTSSSETEVLSLLLAVDTVDLVAGCGAVLVG
jgi:hypothetical protein